MASKSYSVDGIGEITVYKRRGTRRMNLRLVGNRVRVTQPTWLPYAAGIQFVRNNAGWISGQRLKQPELIITNGMAIGKGQTLRFERGLSLRTRLSELFLTVYVPPHLTDSHELVQSIAKDAIKRALKKQADKQLPERLAYCAQQYGFNYKSMQTKSMRTRWGSCTSAKHITLNIFLMMAPWELIDYVLIHELVHTRHLHHGDAFWNAVEAIMPDYKERRKQLKTFQRSVAPLQ